MPLAEERALKREAAKKFPGDKQRQNRYVFGTLMKQGWRPKRRKASAPAAKSKTTDRAPRRKR